jgi:predicted glycosyltransferase
MKVLFDLGHPAHVHLFKNSIFLLQSEGHEVIITARKKDITLDLLDKLKLEYHLLGENKKGLIKKALNLFVVEYELFKVVRKYNPSLIISAGSPYAAHVGKMLGIKSFAFVDTEHANLTAFLTYPFTDRIYTPACYLKNHGKNHYMYDSYHELAYLHPNHFRPDISVFNELCLNSDEKCIVLRLVSWDASHDIDDVGFTNISEFLGELKKYGRLFISSEKKLPDEFEPYRLQLSLEKIHSLLYYSDLYVGESATMASEAALLGTPSVFVSSSTRSYTDELHDKYDLVYTYSDRQNAQYEALSKCLAILNNDTCKEDWIVKRDKMLSEKIDLTGFIVSCIKSSFDNL